MKIFWSDDELLDHWTLSEAELEFLPKRGERLGFAVLFMYFKHAGLFPRKRNQIPKMVVTYLADQIGELASSFSDYKLYGRTVRGRGTVTIRVYVVHSISTIMWSSGLC